MVSRPPRSFWEDGSFADTAWYVSKIQAYGSTAYNVAIPYITADLEQCIQFAKKRFEKTGRSVTDKQVADSLAHSMATIQQVKDKVAFFAEIKNVENSFPELKQVIINGASV